MNLDFLSDANSAAWLRQRMLYLTRGGSHSYGTSTPSSDVDLRGIAAAPREIVLGFSQGFQQLQLDVPDVLVLELRRFFALAADAQAWALEQLFVHPDDVLLMTPIAEELIAARQLFLSRKVRHTFSGYAMAQLKRLRAHHRWIVAPPAATDPDRKSYEQWKSQRNPKRAALEDRFGYDSKFAMHIVRLLRMAHETLRGDGLIVRRPDAAELLSIRDGAWSFEQLDAWAVEQDQQLAQQEQSSPLPHSPDREALTDLCCKLVEKTLLLPTPLPRVVR
jgi:hypothetical protein